MRKIIALIILLLPAALVYGQLQGSGTHGDGYYGTMEEGGDVTWSSDTYIAGDVTVDDEKLTISAGVNIIFQAEGADLIITGTGQLEADGTSGSMIRFTADDDNDQNYGETGERWGHISFQSMGSAGASSITYCIIEYGRKAGTIGTLESVGGGLHVDFNNITISDNIFQNNYAFFGGAVFINSSRNPSITRCIFRDNSVREAGGAVYLYNSSSTIISNCIFDSNYSKGQSASYYSGGAIQFGVSINSAKVINSSFVNNTSDRTGDSFYTLSGGSVINSILWGSSDQTGFYSSGGSVSYSAIQGYSAGSHFSNCFNLNSSNSASDGPNFVNPSGNDFSIEFISPCRDTGTSSGAPDEDYIGNERIGNHDIGAYEVQYSRWKTNAPNPTYWSGETYKTNWEEDLYPGSSGSTGDVIIPAGVVNIPNVSTVTMETGKYLIIDPKAQATFGTLTNNSTGTLWLKSDSYGINDSIASLKVDTYVQSGGTTKTELYLQGNGSMWHYISPPIASLAATTFSSASAAVAKYREDLIEDDMNNGWVTSTGYHYDVTLGTPAWVDKGWTWTNLLAGEAYNYYSATSKKFTINGTLNTNDVSVDLYYNSGSFTPDYPNQQGYNLIGNPFSCSLDWDLVVEDDANSSVWDDAEATIYFRKSGLTYYYNYGSGETVPDDYNTDGNLIPPMQGFFVKTNDDVELTIPADAKTHSSSKRYKGIKNVPKIRLQFENEETSDQTLIWFSEKATLSFDNLCDSRKLFLDNYNPYVYTSLAGIKYSINGINFPETSISIPLVVNSNTAGSYTIKATQIYDLDNYTVYLKDIYLNNTINLYEIDQYSFSTSSGLLSDRFSIIISNITTTIEEPTLPKSSSFNIYHGFDQINIQTLSEAWDGKSGSVRILDMAGKTITDVAGTEFSRNSVTQLKAPEAKGLYLVEIKAGVKRYVGKVVIK